LTGNPKEKENISTSPSQDNVHLIMDKPSGTSVHSYHNSRLNCIINYFPPQGMEWNYTYMSNYLHGVNLWTWKRRAHCDNWFVLYAMVTSLCYCCKC